MAARDSYHERCYGEIWAGEHVTVQGRKKENKYEKYLTENL